MLTGLLHCTWHCVSFKLPVPPCLAFVFQELMQTFLLKCSLLTDPTKFHLTFSTQFSYIHNVPSSITFIYGIAQVTCSSPIIVPTGGFHSQLPFKIMYSSQADMHLGADWIKACQPEFVHGWYLSMIICQWVINGYQYHLLLFMAHLYVFPTWICSWNDNLMASYIPSNWKLPKQVFHMHLTSHWIVLLVHINMSSQLWCCYRFSYHKIQVFNESDQAVEQWFLSQFPQAKTNDNKNVNTKKTCSQPFTAKKKIRMDSEQVPNSSIFTPPYYRL